MVESYRQVDTYARAVAVLSLRERDIIILLEFDMVLYNWSRGGGVENNKHVRRDRERAI